MDEEGTYYAHHSEDLARDLYFADYGIRCEEGFPFEVCGPDLDREFPDRDENEALTGTNTSLRVLLTNATEPGWIAGAI
jgi:hypothetical protein